MRRIWPLATCLVAIGCIATLDESLLTGGGDRVIDGGADDGGSDDGGVLSCDEFDPNDAGVPDGWRVVNGNWSFDKGNGGTWKQTQAPGSNTLYRAVFGSTSWRHVSVEAELIAAGGSGIAECVMARFLDRDHFYRLCLEGGSNWRLSRVENGTVTVLKSGSMMYAAGSRHMLKLEANGNTLTANVDTLAPATVNDKIYQSGSVGLATESTTAYDRFCVEVQ